MTMKTLRTVGPIMGLPWITITPTGREVRNTP